MPVMAQTCPAVRKPFTLLSGSDKIVSIAGGTVNKEVNMEKFGSPRRMASFKAMRWTGAVVSKPIAKNTISLSGFSLASDRASKGVYSIRISAPLAFTLNKGPGVNDIGKYAGGPQENTVLADYAGIDGNVILDLDPVA